MFPGNQGRSSWWEPVFGGGTWKLTQHWHSGGHSPKVLALTAKLKRKMCFPKKLPEIGEFLFVSPMNLFGEFLQVHPESFMPS